MDCAAAHLRPHALLCVKAACVEAHQVDICAYGERLPQSQCGSDVTGFADIAPYMRNFSSRNINAIQVAACGTSNETQFWLNAKTLKSRDLWSSGWLQRSQRLALAEGGPPCKVLTTMSLWVVALA